jgi:hypothetical protein
LVEGMTEDEVMLLQRSFVAGLAQQLAAAGMAPAADTAPNNNQQQSGTAANRATSGTGSSSMLPNGAQAAAAADPFSPPAGSLMMQQVTSAGLASPSPTPLSLAQTYAAAARGSALLSPPRGHLTAHPGADQQQQQQTPLRIAPSGSLQLPGAFSSPAGLQHPAFDLVQLLMSPSAQPHDLAAALQSPQQQPTGLAASPSAAQQAAAAAAGGSSGGVFPGMGLATLPAASLTAAAEHCDDLAAAAAAAAVGPAGGGAGGGAGTSGTACSVLNLLQGGVSAALRHGSGSGSAAADVTVGPLVLNQAPLVVGGGGGGDDDDDEVALVSAEGVPGLGGVTQQGRLGSVRLMPSLVSQV